MYAVWIFCHGQAAPPFVFPYRIQSPITSKQIRIESIDDVWAEIESIDTPRSMGQEMFYLVPLFSRSEWLIDDWMWRMIEDYHLSKKFDLPLSHTLDDAPAEKLECFNIIENELAIIHQHDTKKNGTK